MAAWSTCRTMRSIAAHLSRRLCTASVKLLGYTYRPPKSPMLRDRKRDFVNARPALVIHDNTIPQSMTGLRTRRPTRRAVAPDCRQTDHETSMECWGQALRLQCLPASLRPREQGGATTRRATKRRAVGGFRAAMATCCMSRCCVSSRSGCGHLWGVAIFCCSSVSIRVSQPEEGLT